MANLNFLETLLLNALRGARGNLLNNALRDSPGAPGFLGIPPSSTGGLGDPPGTAFEILLNNVLRGSAGAPGLPSTQPINLPPQLPSGGPGQPTRPPIPWSSIVGTGGGGTVPPLDSQIPVPIQAVAPLGGATGVFNPAAPTGTSGSRPIPPPTVPQRPRPPSGGAAGTIGPGATGTQGGRPTRPPAPTLEDVLTSILAGLLDAESALSPFIPTGGEGFGFGQQVNAFFGPENASALAALAQLFNDPVPINVGERGGVGVGTYLGANPFVTGLLSDNPNFRPIVPNTNSPFAAQGGGDGIAPRTPPRPGVPKSELPGFNDQNAGGGFGGGSGGGAIVF